MQDWKTNAEIATALFVITDPIATIPIFITLTSRRTGINIISRLLGLVLAAVAVEFIARGLGQLLPGLAR